MVLYISSMGSAVVSNGPMISTSTLISDLVAEQMDSTGGECGDLLSSSHRSIPTFSSTIRSKLLCEPWWTRELVNRPVEAASCYILAQGDADPELIYSVSLNQNEFENLQVTKF